MPVKDALRLADARWLASVTETEDQVTLQDLRNEAAQVFASLSPEDALVMKAALDVLQKHQEGENVT